MAKYRMQAPDGNTYEIEGPEGASDDQVRAEIIRQNPALGETPAPRGPATRGRGGDLAEEQAAMDRVTGRNDQAAAPSAAAPPRRSVGRPGLYAGLLDAPAEAAMSFVTGGIGQAAGALRNLVGMARGEDVAHETGQRGAALADSLTYHPRTVGGQAITRGAALPFEAIQKGGNYVQDRLTDAGHPTAGVAANSAIQILPQAAIAVLGMKDAPPAAATPAGAVPRPSVGPVAPPRPAAVSGGWAPPPPPKPPGMMSRATARFRQGGAEQVAGQILYEEAGLPVDRRALAAALRNVDDVVPGVKPTVAEVVQGMPEGSPIQAYQDYLSRQTGARRGAPSTRFGKRLQSNERAIVAAERMRDTVTAPMRRQALANANKTTSAITAAEAEIADRYASKAGALQEKGRFQSTAAEQARRAVNKDAPGGPITSRLGLDRPSRSTPPQATGAASRPPAKYTASAARAEEAGVAAAEMDPIIARRQAELAAAEGKLSNLTANGAEPLTGAKVEQQVARVQGTPGLRASDVVQKSMSKLREKLGEITRPDGTIDAQDLYTVRKELGSYIEAAAKESANWDKKLSGGLLRDMQKIMDDAIESSGGTGWKAYLQEYSRRSDAIDFARSRMENWRKSKQPSAVGAGDHVEQATATGLPQTLTREGMIANAILRHANKKFAPRVEQAMTEMMMDPEKLATALENNGTGVATPKAPRLPGNRLRAPVRGMAAAGASQQKKEKR